MKKISYIFISIILVAIILFSTSTNVFAATLNNVTADVTKTKMKPGEEVTVTVNFGQSLGSYTVDFAYDSNVFDYVSSEGGTANDNGTRVRLVYYDTTGAASPRTSAKVTFKAKTTISGSTPTDFAITLEGLANADASVTYDDIKTPIKKDVLVEPESSGEENQKPENTTPENTTNSEKLPETLPKTGNMQYILVGSIVSALVVVYIVITKRNK